MSPSPRPRIVEGWLPKRCSCFTSYHATTTSKISWQPALLSAEDEGRSVASGTARGEETAGRRSNRARKRLAQELLDMLVELSVYGTSGVVWGLPGDGNSFVKRVELPTHTAPPCFLSHQLGHRVRTVLLDCSPRYDHDGTRWKEIEIEDEDCCDRFNVSVIGKLGHAPDQRDARNRTTSRSGYNWVPFRAVDHEHAVVNHTSGAQFGPGGWLKRARNLWKYSLERDVFAVSLAVRQVSTCSRNLAGASTNLPVSPQRWARWTGVVHGMDTYCPSVVVET